MTQWTSTQHHLPGDWDLVVAVDAEQNYYLVEWDQDKKCFWDQGTRFSLSELTYWLPVPEAPAESSEHATLPLAS